MLHLLLHIYCTLIFRIKLEKIIKLKFSESVRMLYMHVRSTESVLFKLTTKTSE